MKKYTILLFTLVVLSTSYSQMQSPETFLGYKIGEKFTRHHQIVDYFKTVAAANLQTMKLEQFGTTYEGRELYLAFISSKENMANLDQIKMNNRYKRFLICQHGQRYGSVTRHIKSWLLYLYLSVCLEFFYV